MVYFVFFKFSVGLNKIGDRSLAKAIASEVAHKNDRILDVCAGTGILGQQIKNHGFTYIDGLDFSQGMLDVAKSKDIYKNYICDSVEVGGPSKVDDHSYDVVCMMGGITIGHLKPDVLPELIRMLKPGGTLAFTITDHAGTYPAFSETALEAIFQSLITDGRLRNWRKQKAPCYAAGEAESQSDGEECTLYIATVA